MNEMIKKMQETDNDTFRTVIDTQSPLYLYDNQINCAKEIVTSLNDMTLRRNHVMLIAKMQSGKTGVCNATVNIINQCKLKSHMGIKKFLFISGMNDCGLKDQTYHRLLSQVSDAHLDNTYFSARHKRNKNRYFVLKNSDLPKYKGKLDNTLIFIDECHYGSNEKNILSKFLQRNDIDWKNRNSLIERNTYIVSVSATPFDEVISDKAECKTMVELKTEDEYVGVSKYIEQGLIHSGSFGDKIGDIVEAMVETYERMMLDATCGVVFVRTRQFEELKEEEFVRYNFDVHEMYSNGSKIEYDMLSRKIDNLIIQQKINGCMNKKRMKDKAIKPLLVLIKGAYRAGITLDSHHKDYIYMVYDYSMKSASTAQALLGRMCGYRSEDVTLKTHFYINDKFAEMYSKWENDFSDRSLVPCDKLMYEWVDNEYEGDDAELCSRSCGNFTIDLTDEEIRLLYHRGKEKGKRITFLEEYIPRLFMDKCITAPYNYIMEAALSGKNNYKASSQVKRFDSYSEDSLVYQFRPEKIKRFMAETNRDFLTKEDLGKKCISVVLDAEIYDNGARIDGNRRLLVYYVEVGQRIVVPNQKSMYKKHKDTTLIN